MMVALSSGHWGAGSQERLKAATWQAAWKKHVLFLRMGSPMQRSSTKGNGRRQRPPESLRLTSFGKVSGLLQMSPDAPCQVGKEAQRLYVKYPLHKEVEPRHKFYCRDTGHLFHPSRSMMKVVIERRVVCKFSRNYEQGDLFSGEAVLCYV